MGAYAKVVLAFGLLLLLAGGLGTERLTESATLAQPCGPPYPPCPPPPLPPPPSPPPQPIMPTFTSSMEPGRNPATSEADCQHHQGSVTQVPTGCKPSYFGLALQQDIGTATVYLHNGEFFLNEVDLELPGRGFNWVFERKYRSGVIFDGPLGHNWEFNYNRRLLEVTSQNLLNVQKTLPNAKVRDVVRMDGYSRADLYVRNPDGSYRAPTGFYTGLVKNADDTFLERDSLGDRVIYGKADDNSIARMTQLTDRNGNTMYFQYNDKSQLIRVLDTLGRAIDYTYDTVGHLREVKDFFNRSIKFKYDANGDLIEVTSPAVTGTPNGNDFPQGKTTRYVYSSGSLDEQLNHNLLSITAPSEVTRAGPPRVLLTYDTDLQSPNVDRVLRQTLGGTNQTRIPAGGTIHYEYRTLGQRQPGDFNAAVSQTTVTDRNGNVTEYQFNQLGNIVRVREFTNRNIRSADPEFYETRYEYNKDGEITKVIFPEGNFVEYVYDDKSADRFQQGNLLSEALRPDAKRGADQALIKLSYTYEPIYNQIRTLTEARGHDPSYAPQNGGANSPERYTTIYIFDYQEGNNFTVLAKELGIREAQVRELLKGIPMNLGDLNGDGKTDQIAGNVVKTIAPTVTLLPDSNQANIEGSIRQEIATTFAYNAFGQRLRVRDPEGNVTVYDYYPANDPDGDGRDLTPGVSSEPFGYLKQEIRDAESNPIRNSKTNPTPAQIKRRYLYDRVGNVIKEIDGRGIATEYSVNQLNQVVEIRRAADVSESLKNSEEPKWAQCGNQTLIECKAGMVAFRYRTRIFYDFNDNVIKREIENRDSNNKELAGDWVTYESKYDILDNLIEATQEVSQNPREILVTRYRYDRNENRVLEISPVAAKREQRSNVASYVFDERDLLFTSTRGGLTEQFKALTAHADIPERTTIPNSSDLSTLTRTYDLNRNLKEFIDGADNTGDGKPESTLHLYDGFDRRVSSIDAVGNQTFTQYDPASNVIRVSNFGPVGGLSPTSNAAANFTQPLKSQDFRQPLLSQVEYKYDELNRVFELSDKLFVYQGVEYKRVPVLKDGPLGAANDGLVLIRYEYDRNGRPTFIIEDDLSVYQTRYDGANRVIRSVDPELNEVLSTYDDNNNVVKIVEIDTTPRADVQSGKVPDLRETFTTIYVYDSLNRLIRTTDNLGQTRRTRYDSRDNLILRSDAQGSLTIDPLGLFASSINADGNTTSYFYDGANRTITEVKELRIGAQGGNPLDTSNPANPDGKITLETRWDANNRGISQIDDNGNAISYVYDNLNRLTKEMFADGTTNLYSYDPDDNLIKTVDENGSAVATQYDGINRLIGLQVTPARGVIGTTQQALQYDGLSRVTQAVDNNELGDFNDDAIVTFSYDSLSRRLEEVQNGQAISGQWDGDNRRLGLIYANGRQIEFSYDQLDRIDTIKNQGTSVNIVDYNYIGPWRVLERIYENGVRLTHLSDDRTRDIGYDGLKRIITHRHLGEDNRLIAGFEYGYDRENNKLFEKKLHEQSLSESYTFDSLYRLVNFTRDGEQPDSFQLDGVGNWISRNGVANIANKMNEYEMYAGMAQRYDENGNLTDDGRNRYAYDALNRLRKVTRKTDNALIADYSYDAFGRRVSRMVTNSDKLDERVRYLYDGWQEIEEQREGSMQQYVYGRQLEEPLTLDQDTDNDARIDGTFFYHNDAKAYIAALTDATGQIIERYGYDAYGKLTITDAAGATLSRSAVGNPYLFAGRKLDPETGFYYYRMRYLNPTTGRFIHRDPIGMWSDGTNLGNAYTYVGNNPMNNLDPLGLTSADDYWGSPGRPRNRLPRSEASEGWRFAWGSESAPRLGTQLNPGENKGLCPPLLHPVRRLSPWERMIPYPGLIYMIPYRVVDPQGGTGNVRDLLVLQEITRAREEQERKRQECFELAFVPWDEMTEEQKRKWEECLETFGAYLPQPRMTGCWYSLWFIENPQAPGELWMFRLDCKLSKAMKGWWSSHPSNL